MYASVLPQTFKSGYGPVYFNKDMQTY